MSQLYTIGNEVTFNEKPHLVIRIIDKSTTLFEDNDGKCFTLEESYAELRGPNNEVEFIPLLSREQDFNDKKSSIKGLPPLPWRMRR